MFDGLNLGNRSYNPRNSDNFMNPRINATTYRETQYQIYWSCNMVQTKWYAH